MNDVLKMDIFFVVSTVLAGVLCVGSGLLFWRVNRILQQIEYISKNVARESDLIHEDIADLRRDVRAGKGKLKSMFALLTKFTKRTSKRT